MQNRFIIVEYGCPHLSDELTSLRPNRLAVLKRSWEHVHGFDASFRYAVSPTHVPTYSFVAKLLAHTLYNPTESIEFQWQTCSPYDPSELIRLIETGLEHDDDLIQQWFDGTEILELLNAATNWETMILAIDAISGGHEVHKETEKFVLTVLPNR